MIYNESTEAIESLDRHLRIGGAFRWSVHDHDNGHHDGRSMLHGESLQ